MPEQTLAGALLTHLDRGLANTALEAWALQLIRAPLSLDMSHGDNARWQTALAALPTLQARSVQLDRDTIQIGDSSEASAPERNAIDQALRQLMPWRKGPFSFFGVQIDTEWRSDWKWNRLAPHIEPLAGRRVLDVGCGSGYHCWRMLGAGADFVLGIDPSILFAWQFAATRRYLREQPVAYVPVGLEQFPQESRCFDTVFSMGVLYHRRSPMDHLRELSGCLRSGGQLVLESLVVEGNEHQYLLPADRYARMRNVWFIPTVAGLKRWLARIGFTDIRCVDVAVTTVDEQRKTNWMQFDSLAEALHPQDPERTIEGYPAPCRAILIASAP